MSSFRIVLFFLISLPVIFLQANPVVKAPSAWSRLTLIFNQPKYASGDTAFFSAHLYTEKEMLAEGRLIVTFKINGKDGLTHCIERVSFLQGTGLGQFIIPPAMEPGIYTLTAYVETHPINTQPEIFSAKFSVAGKFHFLLDNVSPSTVAAESVDIVLDVDKDTYQPRQEVTCSIRPTGNRLPTSIKKYTVTVFRNDLFTTEKGGPVNHILHLIPEKSVQNTFTKNVDVDRYYFRGKAILKSTGMPVQDSTFITFYLNDNDFVFGVYTRKDGGFTFPLFQDFDSQEVFYTLSYKRRILTEGLVILEDFPVPKMQKSVDLSQVPDAYTDYWRHKKTIVSSYQYYSLKNAAQINAATENWVDSDIEIDLKKFEPFSNVPEMFINIVPMARYRKIKDTESIRIFLDKDGIFAERDPVFILDGVMTNNLSYVLGLKADMIKRIGVIRTESMLARFGDLGKNGIIVIETSIPNHTALWPRTQNSLFIKGITKPLPFASKTYTSDTAASRIPDLRSCLYWNPMLRPATTESTAFTYFTSDDTGEFVIHVEGLLQNGSIIRARKTFSVTAPQE
jgi:hypothetical protein